MVDIGPTQDPGQVVAALGSEGAKLDKYHPQEAFGIFGQHFDRPDGRGRITGQADGFGSERFAVVGVVAKRCEEPGQRIGGRKGADVTNRKIQVRAVRRYCHALDAAGRV